MTKLTGPTLKYHSIIKREKELIKNLNFKLFPSIARGVFSIHMVPLQPLSVQGRIRCPPFSD